MTVAAGSPLEQLKARLGAIADLRGVLNLLDWDSRVSMPPGGARARAEIAGTLTGLLHERLISDELGALLEELDSVADGDEAALVRVARREWEHARRVPRELAAEMIRTAGIAVAAWDVAKAASDFGSFAPHLERQLELKRRYIECFPEAEEPYDALLDDYEEGITTREVRAIFARLKEELLRLVAAHADSVPPRLEGPFPVASQRRAGRLVLDAFGYDPRTWRIDETPHPFAMKPGFDDIRLTTHTSEDNLRSLFMTMHEFGHGVYEFEIDRAYDRTPLGRGFSSSLHESQSRTWENLVGRSRGFWRWFYPQLQPLFPGTLADIDEDTFVDAVNAVRPGPVRGDADEVTYGLHIMLRFELEQELLAGTVSIHDLPELWNARMKEYLGVDVPDDAHGVLQDMHWAIGYFGYFPTYQLGNVISAQFWARAQEELPDLDEQFSNGEFGELREWLRQHVYRHGAKYPPRELLRLVTGSDVDVDPYVRYLRAKFA